MRVLPLFLNACLAAAMASPALADTYTYTYTGQTYQFAAGAYTTSERVTGEVTVSAPLQSGAVPGFGDVLLPASVISFSFSDGLQTITNASTGLEFSVFNFAANGAGLPTEWSVDLYQEVLEGFISTGSGIIPEYGFNQIETVSEPGFTEDYVFLGNSPMGGTGWLGENGNDPGTWTMTVNSTAGVAVAATPEPASLGLVLSGAVGMAGWVGRRRGSTAHRKAAVS